MADDFDPYDTFQKGNIESIDFQTLIKNINSETAGIFDDFRQYLRTFLCRINSWHAQNLQIAPQNEPETKHPITGVFPGFNICVPASIWIGAVSSYITHLYEHDSQKYDVCCDFAEESVALNHDPALTEAHFVIESFGKMMVTELDAYKTLSKNITRFFPQTEFFADLHVDDVEGTAVVSPCVLWYTTAGEDIRCHIKPFIDHGPRPKLSLIT